MTDPAEQMAQQGEAPWGKTWLLTLVLVVLLLSGWEYFWRRRGFAPELNDNPSLWAFTRSQLAKDDPSALALVGTSRMQLGLDLAVLAQATGRQPIQLAMNAEVPIVVLRHLAQDATFRGVIICDIMEDWFYVEAQGGKAGEWVGVYERQAWIAGLEQRLNSIVQQTFVFRLPAISPPNVWDAWRGQYWPRAAYTSFLTDRSVRADYTKLDQNWKDEPLKKARDAYRQVPPFPPQDFRERSRKIDAMIAPLYERGGEVVFVRFPTSGGIWELEETRYPRQQYWDVFAAEVRARTIHFNDYPSLSQFECPDGSHLDYRDTAAFTKALAEVLVEILGNRWRF